MQSVVMQVHNRKVRIEFSDVNSDNDDDITTPRSSLRSACLMRDSDSIQMATIRMWLFYGMLRKAQDFHPPLYTMPIDRYQQQVRFAPQVTLYFREDLNDVERGYKPIDAEISFRLMGETERSMNEAKALSLANKIKAEFAPGGAGYQWRKGRVRANYINPGQGYHLQINAVSESEARTVLNKILDLQNNSLDQSRLSFTELAQAPPIVPPLETIYGKSRRLPRRRPVGYVRFRHADLHIHGIDKPITLVDATLNRSNPLVRA